MGFGYSGGIERFDDERKLPDEGKPNSRSDLYKDGKLKQQRWYGPDGRAQRNRDFFHGGNEKFPHDHEWDWAQATPRGIDHLSPNWNWR